MDIEKTMEFLLDQQARLATQQADLMTGFTQLSGFVVQIATAQERTNAILTELAERHLQLVERHEELAELHKDLAEQQKTMQERINALILAVERHIADHK